MGVKVGLSHKGKNVDWIWEKNAKENIWT